MKKCIILVLFTSASVSMAWDFSSAWKSFTNYFSFSPKTSGDYLQSTWDSLSDQQKQIAIAAVAVAGSAAAGYAFWPDTREVAKQKAIKHAETIQKEIRSEKIKYRDVAKKNASFKYGIPGLGNAYNVTYSVAHNGEAMVLITDSSGEDPEITYKSNDKFKDIKSLE